jgi:hypothetical protein
MFRKRLLLRASAPQLLLDDAQRLAHVVERPLARKDDLLCKFMRQTWEACTTHHVSRFTFHASRGEDSSPILKGFNNPAQG